MKFDNIDVDVLSGTEVPEFITGRHHTYAKNILQGNKRQLNIVLQSKALRDDIQPVLESFNELEQVVLHHIDIENDIVAQYLQHFKEDGADTNSTKMYTIVKEHDAILKLLDKLSILCNKYQNKETDPVMLKLCYAKLNNLEQDLRRHIYLENNILFPKILKSGLNITNK
ncbi:MAG: hemerythrin domain-containing protein [Bacteroidia bacterium]